MALTKEEIAFTESIKSKIKKYNIRTDLKKALDYSTGQLLYTIYNTDMTELVDAGIEMFLIKKSFSYFLNEYGRVDIPGLGTIKMDPYYFQTEVAKELMDYRKIVLDKTRQSGLSTIFALYSLWRAFFFPAESIDIVSTKQKKAQQFVKKIYSTMNSLPEWMKAPIKYQNQQEITFIHGKSTSTILSESQSENAGRSDSLSVLILDEVAFYQSEKMVRNIIASGQPTLNKTGGQLVLISCVVGDTYIYTNKGIEQVIDYKPENCKLGFNTIPEFKIDGINHQQVSNTFYDSGITPTKKIYLQNGNMNEISEIHPYYIIDETSPFPYFKQSKDIKIGEYSLVSCREKTFGNNDNFVIDFKYKKRKPIYNIKNFKNKITEDMSYFFGLLVGDGYIDFKGQYCIITSNDIETQEWLLNNPHFECHREKRKEDNIHFRLQGKYLVELLKQLGFTKQKAKNKIFPKKLLQMSRNNISALLRGLFDADGHSRTRDGSIGFTSTSKELLKQVKILLDMFGIQISNEKWNIISPEKSTRVKVESLVGQITLSSYFSKLFYEKIGFSIKRKQEKYKLVKHVEYSNSQSYPNIKYWIRDNLINKYVDNKLQQKLAKGIRKGWISPARILRYDINDKTTRHHIKMILDYYNTILNETEEYKKLLDFYEKNWYLLKIKKIDSGKNHTYDFVIPETKSFYANGAITQNTPNGVAGKGSYYYEQVVKAKAGASKDTKYLEIDWWEVNDDDRIQGPKKGYNDILEKAVKEGYYYKPEIKKKYSEFFKPIARERYLDNKWLKAAYDDLGMAAYRQEILHDFIVAGDKVFSEEVLSNVEERLKDPLIKDVFGASEYEGWWVWKKPIPGHRYIIGIDVSTGTSNDYSTAEIFDVGEYEQVAEYKGHMSTPNFSRFIKKIGNYYNEAYLVIECNSIGEAIFNGVYYSEVDPYNNVYKQKKTKNGITRMTGWITDVKTRKLLTNDFIDWITVPELFDTIKIYSKRLWLELSTWIWSGGNRPDHSEGSHDDSIIALALALYLRSKAINSGESFLITDDGEVIESDSKDNLEDDPKKKVSETFDVISSEDMNDDDFQSKHGCSKEEYDWLIGSIN